MDKLYELKEMLCEELKEYGDKGKLDVGGLEIVDKLAHAIKNIDKIIEAYEEEGYSMEGGSYEGGSYGRSYARGGNRRYSRTGRGGSSYDGGGGSYARGRSNARRDSMGRYSGGYSRVGSEEMVEELRELMQEAPNEQTKMEFERLIQKLEQM